jgi:hypothetical protein
VPPTRKARIERERPVDQRDHGTDILAEESEPSGGIDDGARVVRGRSQRSPREIDTLATVRFRIFASSVKTQVAIADRGQASASP